MTFTRMLASDLREPYNAVVSKWKATFMPPARDKQQPPAASAQEGQQKQ
jgi:hypothetical protein